MHTRVASTGSPWLSKCEVGEMHTIAISHGAVSYTHLDVYKRQACFTGEYAVEPDSVLSTDIHDRHPNDRPKDAKKLGE